MLCNRLANRLHCLVKAREITEITFVIFETRPSRKSWTAFPYALSCEAYSGSTYFNATSTSLSFAIASPTPT